MYEKLVKRLREHNGWALNETLDEAADAIEELQRQIDGWIEQERKALLKSVPKWIPVAERVPEEYTDVLCYYEYFRYGDYNCMFRTIDRGYFGNGRWGGEAGQGRKNKVLAWMPLPEPPKEEDTPICTKASPASRGIYKAEEGE